MPLLYNLPETLQQRVRDEIRPGEAVSWVGQPLPGLYMRAGFLLWIFFIPWTAFSLFWISAAFHFELPRFDSGQSLFPLFGLPFFLVGVGGLSSPFWLRRKARSVVYAVTNQRAITIEGSRSVTVRSYFPKDIGAVERTEHGDGSGNLFLQEERFVRNNGMQTQKQGFFGIPDVRKVERLIDNLIRESHA